MMRWIEVVSPIFTTSCDRHPGGSRAPWGHRQAERGVSGSGPPCAGRRPTRHLPRGGSSCLERQLMGPSSPRSRPLDRGPRGSPAQGLRSAPIPHSRCPFQVPREFSTSFAAVLRPWRHGTQTPIHPRRHTGRDHDANGPGPLPVEAGSGLAGGVRGGPGSRAGALRGRHPRLRLPLHAPAPLGLSAERTTPGAGSAQICLLGIFGDLRGVVCPGPLRCSRDVVQEVQEPQGDLL
jgi:hypothetical protein